MKINHYTNDYFEEIILLMTDTIKTINSNDYSSDEIEAWISNIDQRKLKTSLRNNTTLVATINSKLVGFVDMDESGLLDHLFVHKDYQNQKIDRTLVSSIEKELHKKYNLTKFSTYASITALDFFLKLDYKVIKENTVLLGSSSLNNYLLEKTI